MYNRYQQVAQSTRLGIPILYGVDAVHGHNNVLGAVVFPHNIGLGCTRNPELVERIGQITAKEVRATGIQWTFAPAVTVPQDIRWGRTYEGFSEDPELVKVLGEAATRGLQGNDLSNPLAVLACAKHYVADGGTKFGTGIDKKLDQGDSQMDEATLR
jgi:beta-glucosidase